MNDLRFNLYGFARPSTRAEISALLSEALHLADELDGHIAAMEEAMRLLPVGAQADA